MNTKFIIENKDEIDESTLLHILSCYFKEGYISNNEKQHCYLMTFSTHLGQIRVSSHLNEKSERIIVRRT